MGGRKPTQNNLIFGSQRKLMKKMLFLAATTAKSNPTPPKIT
jgi:hypothetical protein